MPTRANGQPAFGHYIGAAGAAFAHASGLLVLTLEGDGSSALTRFGREALVARFGLPPALATR